MENMGNIKRKFNSSFKARVALELIKGQSTIAEICSKFSIHPTQAGLWKTQALSGLAGVFNNKPPNNEIKKKDELIEELYRQIGQSKVELDWLKKKVGTV